MNSTENTFIDNVKTDQTTTCNTYKVNMKPLKLDDSSTKKEPDFGDVLYSTVDEKLTLDAQTNGVDNIPIAICVINGFLENFENGDQSNGAILTARFVSLNYMSCETPTVGTEKYQLMMFGNYGVDMGNVKGEVSLTSFVGGKWNTQQCLNYATKQDNIYNKVIESSEPDYCAPACCCFAYSTPGTKSGDWYLPSMGELHYIYVNKDIINEKRIAIKGERFFDEGSGWTSRSYIFFDYDTNTINTTTEECCCAGKHMSKAQKDFYRPALAFLAVEY